ncbi:MAG: UbiX family flavin prenyltransferase [Saprospiraceae bacterium]
MHQKRKIVVGIGGASGAIYARQLLDGLERLIDQIDEVGVVMSENAKFNWKHELGDESYQDYDFVFYDKYDFMAPFASGSAQFDTMVVCPCSMGSLARIAQGISDDLLTRAADVILKERRKLILVPREMPFSRIHLENMLKLHDAGAIICPAIPSFYSQPRTVDAVVGTVIDRVIDLIGLKNDSFRWGE